MPPPNRIIICLPSSASSRCPYPCASPVAPGCNNNTETRDQCCRQNTYLIDPVGPRNNNACGAGYCQQQSPCYTPQSAPCTPQLPTNEDCFAFVKPLGCCPSPRRRRWAWKNHYSPPRSPITGAPPYGTFDNCWRCSTSRDRCPCPCISPRASPCRSSSCRSSCSWSCRPMSPPRPPACALTHCGYPPWSPPRQPTCPLPPAPPYRQAYPPPPTQIYPPPPRQTYPPSSRSYIPQPPSCIPPPPSIPYLPTPSRPYIPQPPSRCYIPPPPSVPYLPTPSKSICTPPSKQFVPPPWKPPPIHKPPAPTCIPYPPLPPKAPSTRTAGVPDEPFPPTLPPKAGQCPHCPPEMCVTYTKPPFFAGGSSTPSHNRFAPKANIQSRSQSRSSMPRTGSNRSVYPYDGGAEGPNSPYYNPSSPSANNLGGGPSSNSRNNLGRGQSGNSRNNLRGLPSRNRSGKDVGPESGRGGVTWGPGTVYSLPSRGPSNPSDRAPATYPKSVREPPTLGPPLRSVPSSLQTIAIARSATGIPSGCSISGMLVNNSCGGVENSDFDPFYNYTGNNPVAPRGPPCPMLPAPGPKCCPPAPPPQCCCPPAKRRPTPPLLVVPPRPVNTCPVNPCDVCCCVMAAQQQLKNYIQNQTCCLNTMAGGLSNLQQHTRCCSCWHYKSGF